MTKKEAQLALANLKRYMSGGGVVDRGTNKAIDMAIEALSQPEPHWIPVEQELPETDDEVLTTYIVNGNRKKRYVETSRYYYDGFSGYWSSPWDEYRIPGTRIEVIAWMPLPEPFNGVTE